MSRKRFTAEQWRVWFEEFERAGLTVRQFCDSKETTTNTFYVWRRRLRTETPARVSSDSPAFVSVQFAPSQLEIDLGDGVVVRVPNDCQSLRPILEVLRDLRRPS